MSANGRRCCAAICAAVPGLQRAFVLVDARHGPKEADESIFGLLDEAAVTYQIVLTKTDKVTPKELAAYRAPCRDRGQEAHSAAYPDIHATSAVKGTGLAELRAEIAALVNYVLVRWHSSFSRLREKEIDSQHR